MLRLLQTKREGVFATANAICCHRLCTLRSIDAARMEKSGILVQRQQSCEKEIINAISLDNKSSCARSQNRNGMK